MTTLRRINRRKRLARLCAAGAVIAVSLAAWARWSYLATPANASPETALTAFLEGNPAEAFRHIRSCAVRGSSACQEDLAFAYFEGNGTHADPVKGIWWLIRSFGNGNAEAAYGIGSILLTGDFNAHKNQRYALWWLRQASEAGSAEAMKLIGDAYRFGWGVKASAETASAWYVRASVNGSLAAGEAIRSLFFSWSN